jgi:transcription initiation factor IIF auxiliary subunit
MAAKSSLKIAQSQKYDDHDWWSWSVWVDGPEGELDGVDRVEYTLHPTFQRPVRTIATRRNKFKLSTGGWGVFPIYARVFKKDGSSVRLQHQLELRYPDGRPTRFTDAWK